MNEIINQWNQVAKTYSDFDATSRYSNFCKEFVSQRFNNMDGLKILDAGCGNGVYAHIFAENGGTVIGCDGTNEMLNLAHKKYPRYQFDYVNLLERMPYKDKEFDIVFCNLVLMDIDPIDNILSEFHRILKTNGVFFFSIVHPAFYHAVWEKDASGTIASKKVTSYITAFSKLQNIWGATMHYHRPISFYYNKICKNGFYLKEMSEPKVYEDTKIPDIPLYLFSEFLKID